MPGGRLGLGLWNPGYRPELLDLSKRGLGSKLGGGGTLGLCSAAKLLLPQASGLAPGG